MDKGFLLIVIKISIQMLREDSVKTCLASLFSAASLSGRHAQQYLNRIIEPKVDSLFVIPYIVVQEVISSLSRNDNTLILIVPAVRSMQQKNNKRIEMIIKMVKKW